MNVCANIFFGSYSLDCPDKGTRNMGENRKMNNTAFIATKKTVENNGAVVPGPLSKTYGEIGYRRIKGLESLITFITWHNKKGEDTFLVKGEYGNNVETKLRQSGLKFGIIKEDPTTKEWIPKMYNGTAVPATT